MTIKIVLGHKYEISKALNMPKFLLSNLEILSPNSFANFETRIS